jgi:hypothetical protein
MLDHSTAVAHVNGWRNSQLQCSDSLLCPSLAARVVARSRRFALDHALANGADPTSSALLAARAAQLAKPATRYRIAGALEHAALTVDTDRGRWSTPAHRGAVRPNRAEMMRLASVLRHNCLLYARGIALLELILIDGTGPAYTDPRGEGLAAQLRLAADSLTG